MPNKYLIQPHSLIPKNTPSKSTYDLLFATLILTIVFVFGTSNLILYNYEILLSSFSMLTVAIGIVCCLYACINLSKNFYVGLPAVFFLLFSLTALGDFKTTLAIRIILALSSLYTAVTIKPPKDQILPTIVVALISAMVVVAANNAYGTFDIMPRTMSALTHGDTIFHSSIAAMLKNYNIPSTGVHGLVEIPYPHFSHRIFAGLSQLSGESALNTYGIASKLLFVPLLFFIIATTCSIFAHNNGNPLLYFTLSAFILFLAPILLRKFAFVDSYFISESYTISLIMLIPALCILVKKSIGNLDALLLFAYGILMVHTKPSTALVFMGLLLLRTFFLDRGNFKKNLLLSIVIFGAIAWPMVAAASGSEHLGIRTLDFIKQYSYWPSRSWWYNTQDILKSPWLITLGYSLSALSLIIAFILLHFAFSWLLIFTQIKNEGLKSIPKSPIVLFSSALIVGNLMLISCFKIAGGSMYYFTNIPFFIALPSCILLAEKGILNWLQIGFLKILRTEFSKKLSLLALFGIFLSLCWSPTHRYIKKYKKLNYANEKFVNSLLTIKETAPINTCFISSNAFREANVARKKGSPYAPLVHSAVSERPWTNVVVPKENITYRFYNYNMLGITEKHQNIQVPPVFLENMQLMHHED